MIDILLSTDEGFAMPTGVLMHSIGENNTSPVHYHVMVGTAFSDESREALSEIAEHYGHTITFYTLTDDIAGDFPVGVGRRPKHVTRPAYYRLFAAQALPETLHKVLYLDGDMIVVEPLDELWDTDIVGYAVAVGEQKGFGFCYPDISYPKEEYGYFNSGMLLINLDYWREKDCLSDFIRYIDEYEDRMLFHDQDVLNGVLYDKKKVLPMRYNMEIMVLMNGFIRRFIKHFRCYFFPVIIHLNGPIKPWYKNSTNPFTPLWRHYLSLSRWKDMELVYKEPPYEEGKGDEYSIIRKAMARFPTGAWQKADLRVKDN